jgi:N-acetylneuraminate synthase
MGLGVSVASVVLGATFIEKHFTLRRSDGGVDSAFSMEPEELKSLVIETERAWLGIGKIQEGPTESEKPSLQFRRSLYIVKEMKRGEIFTKENLRAIRPGFGLPPKFLDRVLGKKIKTDAPIGTALKTEHFDA